MRSPSVRPPSVRSLTSPIHLTSVGSEKRYFFAGATALRPLGCLEILGRDMCFNIFRCAGFPSLVLNRLEEFLVSRLARSTSKDLLIAQLDYLVSLRPPPERDGIKGCARIGRSGRGETGASLGCLARRQGSRPTVE